MSSLLSEPAFRFLLATLATWRVTHLLAHEDGPADAVFRFRAWLGDSFAGRLMDCFQCLSLWVAAVAAIFLTLKPGDWVLTWLALSGAACLLERLQKDPPTAETPPGDLQGDTDYVLWSEKGRPAQ